MQDLPPTYTLVLMLIELTAFCFSDVINTNTSNDSDKSDKTLVDVSILSVPESYKTIVFNCRGRVPT